MADIGWEPEWEVNPKELKLIERIGESAINRVMSPPSHIMRDVSAFQRYVPGVERWL